MPAGLRAVLVRRDDVAVAVASPVAYPAGVLFDLLVAFRDDLPADIDEQLGFPPGWRPRQSGVQQIPDALLRFGVQLADGGRAANTDVPARPPLLAQQGGDGGGGRWRISYWLQPLPPPGPLGFVCEWPARAVPETRVSVDARPLRAAARQALELWP